MAERGCIFSWPRNRPFGDSKSRPVLLIAPNAATRLSDRWVVVPISSDRRLIDHPLAVPLEAEASNGLQQPSFAMAWLPTTVLRSQLDGPLGRVSRPVLAAVLQTIATALDLEMVEPG